MANIEGEIIGGENRERSVHRVGSRGRALIKLHALVGLIKPTNTNLSSLIALYQPGARPKRPTPRL